MKMCRGIGIKTPRIPKPCQHLEVSFKLQAPCRLTPRNLDSSGIGHEARLASGAGLKEFSSLAIWNQTPIFRS